MTGGQGRYDRSRTAGAGAWVKEFYLAIGWFVGSPVNIGSKLTYT